MIYKGEEVTIIEKRYGNDRIALVMVDAQGTPMLTATTNLPVKYVRPGHVFIKNWSENEGVLEWLINNQIVEDTGERVNSGHVQVPLVKLLKRG